MNQDKALWQVFLIYHVKVLLSLSKLVSQQCLMKAYSIVVFYISPLLCVLSEPESVLSKRGAIVNCARNSAFCCIK